MLKRVVSIGIGLCVLFSCSAFAIDSNTTTTYNSGSNVINVSTSVTGVSPGDTVTYLAYKVEDGAEITADDIVYVDQTTYSNGELSFNYRTATTNIGSTVLVGGDNVAAVSETNIPGCVVIKNADGEVLAYGEITSSSSDFVGSTDTATLKKVTLNTSVNISNIIDINTSGVSVDTLLCFAGNANELWLDASAVNTDDATIITVETGDPIVNMLGLNYITDLSGVASLFEGINTTGKSVSAFGQVVGSSDEFGIVFSTDKAALEALSDSVTTWDAESEINLSTPVAYPALGKNGEGNFVVQLINNDFSSETTIYSRVYSKTGAVYTYSDTVAQVVIGE